MTHGQSTLTPQVHFKMSTGTSLSHSDPAAALGSVQEVSHQNISGSHPSTVAMVPEAAATHLQGS